MYGHEDLLVSEHVGNGAVECHGIVNVVFEDVEIEQAIGIRLAKTIEMCCSDMKGRRFYWVDFKAKESACSGMP